MVKQHIEILPSRYLTRELNSQVLAVGRKDQSERVIRRRCNNIILNYKVCRNLSSLKRVVRFVKFAENVSDPITQ